MILGVTRRQTFETLRREGIRVSGPRLSMTYAPIDPDARVAFAIPRRVGGAVVRNRARRRVRAILDQRRRRGGLAAGVYLVHLRDRLDDLPADALQCEVDRLFAALDARLAG